jgi:subtilisin family serine protease
VNYPARWPTTLAVGAVDRHGRVCPFSSRGDEVDIAAPGEDILSTWPGGAYAKLSGTSMATPFVSGVVALALAKHALGGGSTPLRNVQDLREHLARTAAEAGSPGKDPSYGWGLIDPARMLSAAPAAEAAPDIRFEEACLVLDGKRYRGTLSFQPGALQR